jgi:hypothetical protein
MLEAHIIEQVKAVFDAKELVRRGWAEQFKEASYAEQWKSLNKST